MKAHLKLLSSSLGLIFLATSAHAALVLSGNTAGNFQGSSSGNIVIDNSADGRTASFFSGVPADGSYQSGIYFNGGDFTNIGNGDVFSVGSIEFANGINQLGTSSALVDFDFKIHLTDPVMDTLLLTTIHFGINATPNTGELVPDHFLATFTQPAPVLIDGTWVTFTINNLPLSTTLAEEAEYKLAEVQVNFREMVPAPEPSTYGQMATLGLIGLIGYRRIQGRVKVRA